MFDGRQSPSARLYKKAAVAAAAHNRAVCYSLQPSSNPNLRAIMFSSHRVLLLVLFAVALYPSLTAGAAIVSADISARVKTCNTFTTQFNCLGCGCVWNKTLTPKCQGTPTCARAGLLETKDSAKN
uniref:Uncharacterized protein n=1 Tax=Plectus sambesii TaxID=2011161 RepID=A0A914VAN0_9BILA